MTSRLTARAWLTRPARRMNAAGLTEVLNESFTAGEKDYTALVSKMKDAGIDAVYIGGYHTEGALILPARCANRALLPR